MEEVIVIGVVGAGTMGRGIAMVALWAGFRVVLCDVSQEQLAAATDEIGQRTDRKVEKGEFTAEQSSLMRSRLETATALTSLAAAELVVEAAPEQVDLKRRIFQQLSAICQPDAILATNTSSLSVSELAGAVADPRRVIGLHFFNPVAVMSLVEVVEGADTDPDVVARALEYVRAFGKQPAKCKDTPGFLVNRVARSFYGEALRIVGEGTTNFYKVDRLLRDGAGFPMGPFELMDMIGIDINFAVTQSVYHAYFEDPRYQPHPLQARKVALGQLGRKTGRGFYEYTTDGQQVKPEHLNSDADWDWKPPTKKIVDTAQSLSCPLVIGDTYLADQWRSLVNAEWRDKAQETAGQSEEEDRHLYFRSPLFAWQQERIDERCEKIRSALTTAKPQVVLVSLADEPAVSRQVLQVVDDAVANNALIVWSLAGPSVTEAASWLNHPQRLRGIDCALPLPKRGGAVGFTRPMQAVCTYSDATNPDLKYYALLHRLGWDALYIRDGAGGVIMRTLATLWNEAVGVYMEGVAVQSAIDRAMVLGANYPLGPIIWMATHGAPTAWTTMSALLAERAADRYRPAVGLRQQWLLEISRTQEEDTRWPYKQS